MPSIMIEIVNKKTHVKTPNDVYIGRPSVLGNPYAIGKHGTRDEVCELYAAWLADKVAAKDRKVVGELNRIWKKAKVGKVYLVCWCAPKRCHGDEIKKLIESKL